MTNSLISKYASEIGRMLDERDALTVDLKDKYDEAKAEGITVSALRAAIRIHRLDGDKRKKHDAAQMDLELYLSELEGRREAAE